MENQNPQHFLTDWEGHRVPVSQEVYDAFWYYTNKEDYFMRILKSERFHYDPEKRIAVFLPSREDSYERLLAEGEEYACDEKPLEDTVVDSIMVRHLLAQMTADERNIAYLSYALGKSDDEASGSLGIPQDTYKSRKRAMLTRLRKFFDDSS